MFKLDAKLTTHYDLHRLIVLMTLTAAFVSAGGVLLALAADYQLNGVRALLSRADFLGDYIHSPLAYIFNLAQVAAGICMLLAMLGLYLLKLGNISSYLAFAGSWVGLCIVLMGIFPINYLAQHRLVSTGFMLGTLALHSLCILAKVRQQSICPGSLFALSILGWFSALGLSIQLDWSTLDFAACYHDAAEICWVAINMWLQVQITVLWCVLLALAIRRLAIDNHALQLAQQLAH